MRAPPEAVTTTRGTASSMAAAPEREKRSPTTEPMEPPRNRKSMTPSATRRAGQAQRPASIASDSPVFELRFLQPIHVGAAIEEVEGVRRPQVARHLLPGAGVGQLRDPLERALSG